ncbi:hypothetical protein J5N97_020085 [Dioscorea zingiberensis]|uniref:Cytochrome P450 n=1 Tax=Dioscorea zingiberensis TaxID=325984 RepID=A0A9D5CF44_9LILI|nr:hypothetical protein J5N97_020085 [Dioscorea zingiberensis]
MLLVIINHLIKLRSACRKLNKLPPGPSGLPIIGNLHQLGFQPHRSLRRLSETYGPAMFLQLGQLSTVIISSADTAEEVLKTKDLIFCTRPPLSKARKMFYGGLNIAFTPYNEYWKQARWLCTSHLLNSSKVRLLQPIRVEEIETLMSTIRHQSSSSVDGLVNLSDMLLCLLNNITCREVFGKTFEEDGDLCGRSRFHELVTEWTGLMGHFNIGEFFPSMEWINMLTGLHGRFKKSFLSIDAFLDEVVDGHMVDDDKQGCILSTLLQLQNDPSVLIPLTKESIKAILMDLFIAGTDTGTLVLEWGMAELMKNPKVRRKAQDELRSSTLGASKQKVEESDLHRLKYLKQVVKEILRLHPPAAFLLPREARQDCTINGAHEIPCKTRVMVNVWAIGRDPEKWEEPEKFMPERFENSSVDYKGQNFELLPFGSGRRGCPGVGLGSVVVELALANLLHGFDWEMPEGVKEEELDMEESFGIVLRRKSPLLLKPIPYGETIADAEVTMEGGQEADGRQRMDVEEDDVESEDYEECEELQEDLVFRDSDEEEEDGEEHMVDDLFWTIADKDVEDAELRAWMGKQLDGNRRDLSDQESDYANSEELRSLSESSDSVDGVEKRKKKKRRFPQFNEDLDIHVEDVSENDLNRVVLECENLSIYFAVFGLWEEMLMVQFQ